MYFMEDNSSCSIDPSFCVEKSIQIKQPKKMKTMLKYWFQQIKPTKKIRFYNVWMTLDKLTYNKMRAQYTSLTLADDLKWNKVTTPRLSKDLYINASIKLSQFNQTTDISSCDPLIPIGQCDAQVRVYIGAVANMNGKDYTIEVNLLRTDNFDLCTDTAGCTLASLKPKNPAVDELNKLPYTIVFYGQNIGMFALNATLPALNADNTYVNFTIPVTQIFNGIATSWPWYNQFDGITDWSNATLTKFYFGEEVWGAGAVQAQVKSLRLYEIN